MIRDGDNFRVVDGDLRSTILGEFFRSAHMFPTMGTRDPEVDHKQIQFRVRPSVTGRKQAPDLADKRGKGLTRYHAHRLGLRLADMPEYRRLRRLYRLGRAEAIEVIKNSRKAARS